MPGKRRSQKVCPACGSGACARTGLPVCRHTGLARVPDPEAAARIALTRLAPALTTPTVEAA